MCHLTQTVQLMTGEKLGNSEAASSQKVGVSPTLSPPVCLSVDQVPCNPCLEAPGAGESCRTRGGTRVGLPLYSSWYSWLLDLSRKVPLSEAGLVTGRVMHRVCQDWESLSAQGSGLALAGSLSLGVAWTLARMVKQLLAERDLHATVPFSIQSLHPGLIVLALDWQVQPILA